MNTIFADLARSRWASAVAAIAIVVACLLPTRGVVIPGLGAVPPCTFHQLTRLPCPGCGLTRCFIQCARLRPDRAAFYHPPGVGLFLLVVAVAALGFVRTSRREAVAEWIERRPRLANIVAGAYGCVFFAYGFGRIAWLMLTRQPSPW